MQDSWSKCSWTVPASWRLQYLNKRLLGYHLPLVLLPSSLSPWTFKISSTLCFKRTKPFLKSNRRWGWICMWQRDVYCASEPAVYTGMQATFTTVIYFRNIKEKIFMQLGIHLNALLNCHLQTQNTNKKQLQATHVWRLCYIK